MNITFVSSFIVLKEDRYHKRSVEKYMDHFIKLANTGINILLFLDSNLQEEGKKIIERFPNVVLNYADLEETWTFKNTAKDCLLPTSRNIEKDTRNYMILINAKLDFMEQALKLNPFKTDTFAWIDFGIFHVLSDTQSATQELQKISGSNYKKGKIILPMGLHQPSLDTKIWNQVHWTFLGGFFLGDSETMKSFVDEYHNFYKTCCKLRTVWEVNIWNFMYSLGMVEFEGFIADHNNSMIRIPENLKLID